MCRPPYAGPRSGAHEYGELPALDQLDALKTQRGEKDTTEILVGGLPSYTYVLEIAKNGLLAAFGSGDFRGALIKVAPGTSGVPGALRESSRP